jgi:hypothetical protein
VRVVFEARSKIAAVLVDGPRLRRVSMSDGWSCDRYPGRRSGAVVFVVVRQGAVHEGLPWSRSEVARGVKRVTGG